MLFMIVLLTNCFMTRTLSVNKPSIILVRPQLPENIGMVARAMDNFGLNKLILVSPREKWPNKISIKSSANSHRIIKGVKIYKNLKSVLGNFDLVIATSNRKRFLNKPSIKNFDNIFDIFPKNKKICIMFGPENSGLSNEDLILADFIFNIQTSNTNNSLNLSHAVLLFAYKWSEFFLFKKNSSKNSKSFNNIANKKDFIYFMNFLKEELKDVGFLYPEHKSKSMFNNIQSMFLRSALSKVEIQTLWGMVKKLRKS